MSNAAIRIATLFERLGATNPAIDLPSALAAEFQTEVEGPDFFTALVNLMSQLRAIKGALEATAPSERAMAIHVRAVDKLIPFVNPAYIRGQPTSALQVCQNEIDQLFVIGDLLPTEQSAYNADDLALAVQAALDLQEMLQIVEMGPAVRTHLVLILDTLIMALRSHEVLGAEGVARVFGSVAAELQRTINMTPTPSQATVTWFNKVVGYMKQMGSAIVWAGAIAGGATQIADLSEQILGLEFFGGPDVGDGGKLFKKTGLTSPLPKLIE